MFQPRKKGKKNDDLEKYSEKNPIAIPFWTHSKITNGMVGAPAAQKHLTLQKKNMPALDMSMY